MLPSSALIAGASSAASSAAGEPSRPATADRMPSCTSLSSRVELDRPWALDVLGAQGVPHQLDALGQDCVHDHPRRQLLAVVLAFGARGLSRQIGGVGARRGGLNLLGADTALGRGKHALPNRQLLLVLPQDQSARILDGADAALLDALQRVEHDISGDAQAVALGE
eukprot:scaffold3993_cov101-Isochrysis_galbana.AAC.1